MSTSSVRYPHLTVRETQITVANKSGEFIEKFLSKLMSEMDLYTDGMPFRARAGSSNKMEKSSLGFPVMFVVLSGRSKDSARSPLTVPVR